MIQIQIFPVSFPSPLFQEFPPIPHPVACADALAVLYGGAMQVSPERAEHPCRDRFILSKGHSSVGWYAALHQRGFLTVNSPHTFA